MGKLAKILFGVWMVLAITSFVSAFWMTPLFAKIIALVFGGENILIILSLAISSIEGMRAARKVKEMEETSDAM